jgi:hypothetical protein
MIRISIDGNRTQASAGERLLDVINRFGPKLSQVCYHPQLGPIFEAHGVKRTPGVDHSRRNVREQWSDFATSRPCD